MLGSELGVLSIALIRGECMVEIKARVPEYKFGVWS